MASGIGSSGPLTRFLVVKEITFVICIAFLGRPRSRARKPCRTVEHAFGLAPWTCACSPWTFISERKEPNGCSQTACITGFLDPKSANRYSALKSRLILIFVIFSSEVDRVDFANATNLQTINVHYAILFLCAVLTHWQIDSIVLKRSARGEGCQNQSIF